MRTKHKTAVIVNRPTVILDKALDKIKKVECLSGKDIELIASNINLNT